MINNGYAKNKIIMLKIVHLQTLISFQGNAPLRLHEAMLNHGLKSTIIVYNTQRSVNKNFYRYSGLLKLIKTQIYYKMQKLIERKKKPDTYLFSYPKYIGNNVSNHVFLKEADIIYLHWIVGGFLNLKNIEEILKLGKPVFFFMHDMWTITGGCHHSFECNNYKTGCDYCPIFKNEKKYTLASQQFIEKKKLFSKYNNVNFISPSKWLMDCAKDLGLLINKKVHHIPNIVNEEIFKKFDKITAKKILNISEDCYTISFGCVAGKDNFFKGWDYFEEALNIIYLKDKNLPLNIVIYGSEYDEVTENAIPFPVKFMGQINDETAMVILNNASDVFVSPSLAESFGQTFLENIMCGTPVVGFNVGGVPDIIEHKINGYLAEYKSSDDLAEGILYCLNNNMIFDSPEKYFTKITIEKHISFINSVIV